MYLFGVCAQKRYLRSAIDSSKAISDNLKSFQPTS